MIIALTACGSSSKTGSDGTNDQTVSVQSETENDVRMWVQGLDY